jgi:hypothetical protein
VEEFLYISGEEHLAAEFDRLSRVYPVHAPLAFQVYADLKYAKRWLNIQVCENGEFCFIVAQQQENVCAFAELRCQLIEMQGPVEFILPYLSHTIATVQSYFQLFGKLECFDLKPTSMTLAMLDTDSSLSYYKLHAGLVSPTQTRTKDDGEE